jgi:hypothetical protein
MGLWINGSTVRTRDIVNGLLRLTCVKPTFDNLQTLQFCSHWITARPRQESRFTTSFSK